MAIAALALTLIPCGWPAAQSISGSTLPPGSAPPFQISNGLVTLSYAADPVYGLVLVAAGDAAAPGAYTLEPTDLWTVDLRDPLSGAKLEGIGPSQCSFFFSLAQAPGSFTATWSRIQAPQLPPGMLFRVVVDATLAPADRVVELKVSVQADQTSHSLYQVHFPRLQYQESGAPADQVLSYPYVGGWLLPDPMHNTVLLDGAAAGPASGSLTQPGFLSMQWFAHYDAAAADSPLGSKRLRRQLGRMAAGAGAVRGLGAPGRGQRL